MRRRLRNNTYLLIVILLLFITIGFAALTSNLSIVGNTNIKGNTWDVHFENVRVKSGSVSATSGPTITDNTSINYAVRLDSPGDSFDFYVDLVNNGTIDAMIDKLNISEITTSEALFLDYSVTYAGGGVISKGDLLASGDTKKIKVHIKFKDDITADILAGASGEFNKNVKIDFVQADETAQEVINEGLSFVLGNGENEGDKFCYGTECFFVISNDGNTVRALAQYNLKVGTNYISEDNVQVISSTEEGYGLQDSMMKGFMNPNNYPRYGVISFSDSFYWGKYHEDENEILPEYADLNVLDSKSNLYVPLQNYKDYLTNKGFVTNIDLITMAELEELGCVYVEGGPTTCSNAKYEWVYETSYWTKQVFINERKWLLYAVNAGINGGMGHAIFNSDKLGLRPVIEFNSKLLEELY